MSEKYSDILNRQWDDIPEPALLPDGTYVLKCQNVGFFPAPKPEEGEEKKSDRVTFFYGVKEAMDDVRQDDLDALGENYDMANNDVTKNFWINREKDWTQVKRHLALLGVDTKGKSQPETFKEARGAEVLAFLGTREFTNNAGETIVQNEPRDFMKAS